MQQKAAANHSIRALLFDLDGLLLDTETTHIQAYAELSRRLGHGLPAKTFERFVGASHQCTSQFLKEQSGSGKSPEELTRLELEIYAEILKARPPEPASGAAELFGLCVELKLKRALVTSSELPDVEPAMRSLWRNLNCRGDWKAAFDVICTGDRVARLKPAPDLYVLAVKELALPPQACLALEDSPAGITAACAAGVRVAAVPNKYLTTEAVIQGRTNLVFGSLLEVFNNFGRISEGQS
jgi:beta-phosphoglucomutase-like phosphatase (HAD superfamily)